MISFNFTLRNPRSNAFENLWCGSYKTPFKNKFVELEFYKDNSLVSVMVDLTFRRSHAGLVIDLGIFGYNVQCQFYDCRHWDYETNTWETHNEP
jgi:hypothetical protein